MRGTSHSVEASALRGLLAYARALKIPTDRALAAAELSEAALQGPEARVPQASHNVLWEQLAAASGDSHFGLHFAERMTLDTFGVVGHLFARSRTLGQGLERVVAHSRILHDAGRVETERRGDEVVVFPGCRGMVHDFPRQIAEFAAASVVILARAATGKPVLARAVRFRHAAPTSSAEHTRIFGVPPSFDAPETEVALGAEILSWPTLDAQPGLLTYLDAYARDVLARLPVEDDLASQVERLIATTMAEGPPDVEVVARQLGLSLRTLQRRLSDAETSFQAIADGVRRSYAERYLIDDRLSLSEIAFLVGFSEPSNFHRAFRRWTGQTPAAYREEAMRARAV